MTPTLYLRLKGQVLNQVITYHLPKSPYSAILTSQTHFPLY